MMRAVLRVGRARAPRPPARPGGDLVGAPL